LQGREAIETRGSFLLLLKKMLGQCLINRILPHTTKSIHEEVSKKEIHSASLCVNKSFSHIKQLKEQAFIEESCSTKGG
jgi:hypothetical protein